MSDITKEFGYYRQEYSFIFSEPHKELTDNILYILNQISKNKGELCYLKNKNKNRNKNKNNINSFNKNRNRNN
jgi:hypothetical protein